MRPRFRHDLHEKFPPTEFTAAEIASEIWRQIPGCTDFDVSSIGRVRSWAGMRYKCGPRRSEPIILAQLPTSRGYRTVGIRRDDDRKYRVRRVQHLVLETFVGPRPPRMEARHFPDRSPGNNRLSNLSWSTHVENIADKWLHGTMCRGERQRDAKLTDSAVMLLRYLRAVHGVGCPTLGSWFGVSGVAASNAARGRTWSHVPMVNCAPEPLVEAPCGHAQAQEAVAACLAVLARGASR